MFHFEVNDWSFVVMMSDNGRASVGDGESLEAAIEDAEREESVTPIQAMGRGWEKRALSWAEGAGWI